uniref:Uncharacterized protein n=1 Tax=Arundo donax TaxID=35708 RepID=A0A0A8ZXK3_ARUDO
MSNKWPLRNNLKN